MAYDERLLARARSRLEENRAKNRAEQERRKAQVYTRVPEIARLDAAMRGQMLSLVRLAVSRSPELREQTARLRDENMDMQARRAELLVAHGWTPEYLDDIYSCPKCRDSGLYEGVPCTCLQKLYNEELTKALGPLLRSGDECFEHFDLSLYSPVPDAGQANSPREAMSLVYDSCRKFAENFPRVSSNLLLQGGTGLGKTYLSACIARVVADKGYSVCYDTAASALDAFERQKFPRDPADAESAGIKMRRMLSCDLMILDDLGTEMVTALTVSALYTLINDRLIDGKRTVISTNLSKEKLAEKYGQPIFSRLQGEFLCLPFVGKDIRLIKRGL